MTGRPQSGTGREFEPESRIRVGREEVAAYASRSVPPLLVFITWKGVTGYTIDAKMFTFSSKFQQHIAKWAMKSDPVVELSNRFLP